MLGMFGEEPNEPPPRFTFTSLLALAASAYTAYVEVSAWRTLETARPSRYSFLNLIAEVIEVGVWLFVAGALCAIAISLGPTRWGVIGLGVIVGLPVLLTIASALGFAP